MKKKILLFLVLSLVLPVLPTKACDIRISPVGVTPSTAGAQACYDINFELSCDLASGMAISVIFPPETNLYYVTGSNVYFDGRDDRIDVLAQSVVFRLTKVLPAGKHKMKICGAQNPPKVGPHVIGLMWNGQIYNSPEFTFSQTGVTVATVTPKPDVAKECAEYTIEFNVVSESGFGCTCSRSTSFYMEFPIEVEIGGNIDPKYITINGITVNRVSIERNKIVVSSSMHFLEGMRVVIKISKSAGLKNPANPGWYRMTLYTSADRVPTPSKPYYIRPSSISRPTVKCDTPMTCSLSTFVINFSTGIQGDIPETGYIKVFFPKEFYVPKTIDPGNISINNHQIKNRVSTYVDGIDESASITIPTMGEIGPETDVSLVILPDSGIRLPSTYGNHSIDISTSTETTKVPSFVFSVSQSQIGSVTYLSNPAFVTLPATQTITFKTGGCGDLVPDVDTISISFPKEMWMPQSFICQGITINDQTTTKIPYLAGSTLTIAPPANIAGDTWVTVVVPKECGIRNPTKAGAGYKVRVWTTKELSPVISNVVAFASTRLSGAKMELTKHLVDSRVGASVQFITGDAGSLKYGSKINIALPEGFDFRGNVSMMNFSVTGNTPKSVSWSGQTLTISCSKVINSNSVVNIDFDPDAGLVTPKQPGYYKIGISTDSEPETIYSDDVPVNSVPELTLSYAKPNDRGWYTSVTDVRIETNSVLDENPSVKLVLDNELVEAENGKLSIKDGFHVLEAEAVDIFGNVSKKESVSFSVDTIAPTFDSDPGTFYTNGKSFFKMVRTVDENDIKVKGSGDDGITFAEMVAGYISINASSGEEKCLKGSILAIDEAGNKAEYEFEVCFDWTPPKLDLPDKIESNDPVYVLKGVTEPETMITIKENTYPAKDGAYDIRLKLNNGLNFFTIEARDRAGNLTRKNIAITANLEQSLVMTPNNKEVTINGEKKSLKIAPFIQNGNLYAPFDLLMQNCAFKLESWPYSEYKLTNDSGKSVFVHPRKTIEMAADNDACVVDGEIVKMPAKPILKSGILFVPVRFTVGLFGLVPLAQGKSVKISYIKN